MNTQKAVFGMGCFWQPEYIFSRIKGVTKTSVGYAGCNIKNHTPSYEEVCSGETGCAEVILIEYNPDIITYHELLDLFWRNHDPTTINRQGPDIGTQYRSAIFCFDKEQLKIAKGSKLKWEKRLLDKNSKIFTEITLIDKFYPAEEYHQKYLEKTGGACHISKGAFK